MSKNNPLKRTLTLDLNAASTSTSKKARVQQLQQNHILTSPDVQMLKLTSPELEQFLSRNPTLATPTPSGYGFPKSVTEEQEMYAKGFEEALKNMHNSSTGMASGPLVDNGLMGGHLVIVTTASGTPVCVAPATDTAIRTIEKATAALRTKLSNNQLRAALPPPPQLQQHLPQPSAAPQIVQNPPRVLAPFSNAGSGSELSRPSSGASGSMDSSMDSPYAYNQIHIKEEKDDMETSSSCSSTRKARRRTTSSPQPNSSLVYPLNMQDQEKSKLERKRQRNRLAASKCRKRKLERISQLDKKVNELKGENSDLANVVKRLKDAVCNLKQEVLEHVKNGCQISLMEETNFNSS
jgi:hypothetical protein